VPLLVHAHQRVLPLHEKTALKIRVRIYVVFLEPDPEEENGAQTEREENCEIFGFLELRNFYFSA